MEEDECIEMDEIGSNDQEKGLPDEETLEPLMEGDNGGKDQESLKEGHQEKNSDAEQGAEDQVVEDPNELVEVELHQAEEVERLSGPVEVNVTEEE